MKWMWALCPLFVFSLQNLMMDLKCIMSVGDRPKSAANKLQKNEMHKIIILWLLERNGYVFVVLCSAGNLVYKRDDAMPFCVSFWWWWWWSGRLRGRVLGSSWAGKMLHICIAHYGIRSLFSLESNSIRDAKNVKADGTQVGVKHLNKQQDPTITMRSVFMMARQFKLFACSPDRWHSYLFDFSSSISCSTSMITIVTVQFMAAARFPLSAMTQQIQCKFWHV